MKNPVNGYDNLPLPLVLVYQKRSYTRYPPQIEVFIKNAVKLVFKVVITHKLEAGFLHLFFGEEIAGRCRYGDLDYYPGLAPVIPMKLLAWITSVSKMPQFLRGLTLTRASEQYLTQQKEKINALLQWALTTSRVKMLVTLDDGIDLALLQRLQKSRLVEHQLKMLEAIIQGYEESFEAEPEILGIHIPSNTKQVNVSYRGVRFCSYETFLHLKGEAEDLAFSASNIIEQLDADYLHHGLGLSAKALHLCLQLHIGMVSGRLMRSDQETESFYATEFGKKVLARYLKHDQLQEIVHHHRLSAKERGERHRWHKYLKSNSLPPRLQTRVKKELFSFQTLYSVTRDEEVDFIEKLRTLYSRYGYRFDGYFSSFARLLLDAGCNVKYVLQAYTRFSYSPHYLCRYPFGKQQLHYTLSLHFLHDFYGVLHPALVQFFHLLKNRGSEKDRKKVANTVLKSTLSYNLETTDNLAQLTQLLNALILKLKADILLQKEVVTQLRKTSSLSAIVAICDDRVLAIDNAILHTIKHTLHVQDRHLEMASKMLVKEPYIDLCTRLCDKEKFPDYHAPSPCQESVLEATHFSVGILSHNNPLALLGPSLSSVCIDFGSSYHHQQLNPAFLNLCVYDQSQLILWGLLCRAYDEQESKTVYILNNFQGSINNNRIRPIEVKKAVHKALKSMLERNAVDAILMKEQFFNTINLCEGLPIRKAEHHRYILEQNARLDFDRNDQGVVGAERFYLLKDTSKARE